VWASNGSDETVVWVLVKDGTKCEGDANNHVAFGIESEIQELRKGELYY